jgi:uncharacterized phage protein (TIGR02218 family)
MRPQTPALAARLAAGVTTLVLLWRVVRRDGVALGFGSHDRDVVVDGFRYRAAPGMVPSAIRQTDGFDVDVMEVAGALSADLVTAADLAAGRYDGAAVTVSVADWEVPDAGAMVLARGTLGAVSSADGGFEAELRGPTAGLSASPVPLTSPECRASLGDARCGVDLAKHVRLARVTAATGLATFEVDGPVVADGTLAYGRARFFDDGSSHEIMEQVGAALTLREVPGAMPEVGALVELRAGCDRRFETCAGRFANATNFRGEPHLPGGDALARYPGM